MVFARYRRGPTLGPLLAREPEYPVTAPIVAAVSARPTPGALLPRWLLKLAGWRAHGHSGELNRPAGERLAGREASVVTDRLFQQRAGHSILIFPGITQLDALLGRIQRCLSSSVSCPLSAANCAVVEGSMTGTGGAGAGSGRG